MIAIDWTMTGLGALIGVATAVLFFAGLAWGMRIALSRTHPTPVLLASSALRIAALLGVGWLVAGQGVAALAGFGLAFVLVRFTVVAMARPAKPQEVR